MNEYVTLDELKTAIEAVGSTYLESDAKMALEAASRSIDSYCGRRFYPDEDDEQERYYTATGGDVIWIDDLITLTSVKSDDGNDNTYENTWTLNSDFILEPRNATGDGYPYSSIRRLIGSAYVFPSYANGIKVTGMFGWSTAPAPVREATMLLASRFMKRAREAPFGVVTFGVDNAASARIGRLDPDVRFLLEPYRRWRPFL